MIIKRLQNKEYNLLSKYINNFYKKGHILSKYKKLFDWMYFDTKTKKYNFLIAKDKLELLQPKGFNLLNYMTIILVGKHLYPCGAQQDQLQV